MEGCCQVMAWASMCMSLQVISDLLKPEKSNLVIHEDAKRGVYVHGLSEWVVRSPDEVSSLNNSTKLYMSGAACVSTAALQVCFMHLGFC